MAKRIKVQKGAPGTGHNPVARHAGKFNRNTVFRDRTKYSRRLKHKTRDAFPIPSFCRWHSESVAVRVKAHFCALFSAHRMHVLE